MNIEIKYATAREWGSTVGTFNAELTLENGERIEFKDLTIVSWNDTHFVGLPSKRDKTGEIIKSKSTGKPLSPYWLSRGLTDAMLELVLVELGLGEQEEELIIPDVEEIEIPEIKVEQVVEQEVIEPTIDKTIEASIEETGEQIDFDEIKF